MIGQPRHKSPVDHRQQVHIHSQRSVRLSNIETHFCFTLLANFIVGRVVYGLSKTTYQSVVLYTEITKRTLSWDDSRDSKVSRQMFRLNLSSNTETSSVITTNYAKKQFE